MTDVLGDHVISQASGPAKYELLLPKSEQMQIFIEQILRNLITVT